MPAKDLVQILSTFDFPTRDDVVLGPENLDDAGALDLGDGRLLLQTVDFFPPIVDDPESFGAVAAANALSDIYAMGGEPISALNIVGFPRKKLDIQVLGAILRGGADKIREAGAALLGGHTVEDTEIKYGLAVTGIVSRDSLRANADARVGDVLVLSKPLGMGALSTSIQKGKGDPAQVERAIEVMATLNAGAARAIQGLDVHAVTDITGFGLLGHASEIARAAAVTMKFDHTKLPFTDGALELAKRKILSGGAKRNREYVGDHAAIAAAVPEHIVSLAFDSETSGGLLMTVSPSDTDALITALREQNTPCAVVVGEVGKQEEGVWVRLD